jgi:GT2 family glycosyltransferase
MLVSVIICTHNPREIYLKRTLQALQLQTLSLSDWELLLIDNASSHAVSNTFDLRWHPHGRHIQELELGLTPARLRGIKESQSPILIFVDDDNLLYPHYLENALQLLQQNASLGAFGGRIIGEYEIPCPDWLKDHSSLLAVRDVTRSVWSHNYDWECTPLGAGLIIRKNIALAYAKVIEKEGNEKRLDRQGNNTMGGGDIDMAYTAVDMQYAIGRFTELELRHLIPKERLQLSYILELSEGAAFSQVLLEAKRKASKQPQKSEVSRSLLQKIWLGIHPPFAAFRMMLAWKRGLARGKRYLLEYKTLK